MHSDIMQYNDVHYYVPDTTSYQMFHNVLLTHA